MPSVGSGLKIESVLQKARNPDVTLPFRECLAELSGVETMRPSTVHADPTVRRAARSRLQPAYYDPLHKVGSALLRPGADIDLDDDI
jgi:hypothetical protein